MMGVAIADIRHVRGLVVDEKRRRFAPNLGIPGELRGSSMR
jgi:hypothetical protein